MRPGVRPLPGGAGSVKFLTSVADVLTAAEHKTFVEVFAAVNVNTSAFPVLRNPKRGTSWHTLIQY